MYLNFGTTAFGALKILPFVNIQVERVNVIITQYLVRVNSQGCNGQSLDSDRTWITQSGALASVLADHSIPPNNVGLMTYTERSIERNVLASSRGFFVEYLTSRENV